MAMANVSLLAQVGSGLVEPRLKPWLFFAGGYLPQVWVFKTESGPATMTVANNGSTAAQAGAAGSPDVTVEWSDRQLDAALTVALTNGDRSTVPRNPPPKVTTHTSKGKTAANLLLGQLGI